jgi:mono/diheme cytochrome c family protein
MLDRVPNHIVASPALSSSTNDLHLHISRMICAVLVIGGMLLSVRSATGQDGSKIAAGETVYNTYCATCHGDGLVSSGQTFDLRRLDASSRSRFETSVMMGKNQMPPWKGVLSADEIDQLWHFIRSNAYEK